MHQRQLGQGLKVSAIGLGCMGMSEFYGPRDDEQSIKTRITQLVGAIHEGRKCASEDF